MFTINLPDEIIERLHSVHNHPHFDIEEEVDLVENIAEILYKQEEND